MPASTEADRLREAILATADASGLITPAGVRDAARDRKNPLHGQFNWNKDAAAEQHWLDTARRLIKRYVTVEVYDLPRKITSVQYVRDPDLPAKVQGYVSLTSEGMDQDRAVKVMLAEIERCVNAIERARDVVAVLEGRHPGLGARLDRSLAELARMRGLVGDSAAA